MGKILPEITPFPVAVNFCPLFCNCALKVIATYFWSAALEPSTGCSHVERKAGFKKQKTNIKLKQKPIMQAPFSLLPVCRVHSVEQGKRGQRWI